MDLEIIKWLQDLNFHPPEGVLELNKDKPIRFDRDGKKNAWFWGTVNHSKRTGEPYIIAVVGDWKTDEQYTYQTHRAYTKEDKKTIQADIKAALERAEKQRLGFQMEASEIATSILAGSRVERPTEYMEKKQIPQLYGAKVCKRSVIDSMEGRSPSPFGNENILIIPMRDHNGRLWGLQKINSKGDKYFLTGQRKEGCFHLIPDDDDRALQSDDPIYVCEGFATGASVHQATLATVAVAFDAGNLLSVCKAIRAENEERPIIICADDDLWARRPDGTPYNAGREKGEEAAKAVLGKVIFPKFRDDTGHPTDFNDLHVREGLEEVKKQILEVKPERHFVNVLGHKEGTYYYTSSDNQELVATRAHGAMDLLNIMPMSYWEHRFPGKRGIDWYRAADELMVRCRQKGIFTPENVRGIGVWEDAERVVVHLGDRLYVGGQEVGIHSLHSRFIYALGPSCRAIHRSPLTLDECRPIHDLMNLLNFEKPAHKYFMSGWIMAARLSGLLRWRPHLWLTGESGSGKSTIMQEFLYPMLGDQRRRATGGTTEAGMRQKIKADAVPVIYDEFETDTLESTQRVKQCIEFIRQASTDSGEILKGSLGGEAIQYKARFCAAVSAIRTHLTTQADRTRFTTVELQKVHHDPKQWARVEAALRTFTADYADRYFARLLALLPIIKQNMRAFEMSFAEKHSQRLGQQYGPLMAGWASISSDGVIPPDEVEELVGSIDLSSESAAGGETDQVDCLGHLLSKRISIQTQKNGRHEITVVDALRAAKSDPIYNEQLGDYGLKLMRSSISGEGFFIANQNPQLSQLYRDSTWRTNWGLSLGRLAGAKKNYAGKISGRTIKGVLIPIASIFHESD